MGKRRSKSFEGLILGAACLTVKTDELIPLLNVLLELGESYSNIRNDDCTASVDISYPAALKAEKRCRAYGITVDSELYFGLPYLVARLFKRPGIIAGIVAAAIIIALSGGVIWDVRIESETGISESDLKAILASHGVYPGAKKSKLDVGRIQAEIESESREIAWISVNVVGSVAYVELIEEVIPQPTEVFDGVNLIASCDGVITGLEVITGMPVSEVGMTVRKGELLVSGLYDSERFGFRAVESSGNVFARTEESFSVEIPFEYTVRAPQKSEILEISLIFFNFRQKIFKKGGFSGINYDIIYSDIYIYDREKIKLPVGLSVGRCNIYSEEIMTRSPSEAVDLAYLEINRQILSRLPDAEILSKSYDGAEVLDGSAYKLICVVSCIRDIAEAKPFNINLSE